MKACFGLVAQVCVFVLVALNVGAAVVAAAVVVAVVAVVVAVGLAHTLALRALPQKSPFGVGLGSGCSGFD